MLNTPRRLRPTLDIGLDSCHFRPLRETNLFQNDPVCAVFHVEQFPVWAILDIVPRAQIKPWKSLWHTIAFEISAHFQPGMSASHRTFAAELPRDP